jgi:aromatic ring-opening dioxygenase LigB subunit
MNNVKSIITRHNARIIRKNLPQSEDTDGCNCRKACPLQDKYKTKGITYKATVITSNRNNIKHYIGMTSTTLKERYRNHNRSFNHKKYSNDAELSKYIWKLKKQTRFRHNLFNTKTRCFLYGRIRKM